MGKKSPQILSMLINENQKIMLSLYLANMTARFVHRYLIFNNGHI
jgi:hypothetical protein